MIPHRKSYLFNKTQGKPWWDRRSFKNHWCTSVTWQMSDSWCAATSTEKRIQHFTKGGIWVGTSTTGVAAPPVPSLPYLLLGRAYYTVGLAFKKFFKSPKKVTPTLPPRPLPPFLLLSMEGKEGGNSYLLWRLKKVPSCCSYYMVSDESAVTSLHPSRIYLYLHLLHCSEAHYYHIVFPLSLFFFPVCVFCTSCFLSPT